VGKQNVVNDLTRQEDGRWSNRSNLINRVDGCHPPPWRYNAKSFVAKMYFSLFGLNAKSSRRKLFAR